MLRNLGRYVLRSQIEMKELDRLRFEQKNAAVFFRIEMAVHFGGARMRKGLLFIIILLVLAGLASLFTPGKGRENVGGGDPPAVQDLIVNGTFSDDIQGWELKSNVAKPQHQLVQISGMPGKTVALTAEHQGFAELSQRVKTPTPFVRLRFKANFLSTQGNGYVRVTALDAQDQPLGRLGWAVTGEMPPAAANEKWDDRRVPLNTLGTWLEQDFLLVERLQEVFPQLDYRMIRGYQVDFLVSGGQHGLFGDVHLLVQERAGLVLEVEKDQPGRTLGEDFSVTTVVSNKGQTTQQAVVVRAVEPPGWGLVVREPVQSIETIAPGETKVLHWSVRAQRPSTVNFGKPWDLLFKMEGGDQTVKTVTAVEDPAPGKIYYVLTDDLEPIDGAGYAKAYGNQNAWLDPEEFTVQLVQKAERLNTIARSYGAKWSHYIAWTAVHAAQWASAQSKTGAWPMIINRLEQSVQAQAGQGHEYAVHLHSDYDPRFPGNILQYNAAADGFWANHRRHGWAHNLSELGTPEDVATRTGSLYYYHSRLTELLRKSGQGQIIAARLGSFDFGDVAPEEGKSMEAYRRAGIMAGSDADGNMGGATSADFGKSLFISREDDINTPADDVRKIGILEFKPTPEKYISFDSDNAEQMNGKLSAGMRAFTREGKIVPGVHAIVGFTHAMFVMGEGDWRTLEGGQFAQIERHLAFVQENFAAAGLLQYATSSEMAKAYWDYYSPTLLAVYGSEQQQSRGNFVYPIQILGSQIPVDAAHVHRVKMKYPLYLRDKAYKIEVRKNGQTIMKTWGLPTPFNDIEFSVDDRTASYTLHVYAGETRGRVVKMLRRLKEKNWLNLNN